MLVISRRIGETVRIGDAIQLILVEVRGDKVRLGVEAPSDIPVHREEVWNALHGPQSRAIIDAAWLAWNDGIVLRLARAIVEGGNYDALPILADALEEAGCLDADILGHCRNCACDTRSSWVVDMILSAS